MRWIIGDVHGCALELDDLLARIRFDPAEDELWTTGDLVNRGTDSLAALRLWRDVEGRAVLGNHDVYALLAHAGAEERYADDLDPLFAAPDRDPLLARLLDQPVLVSLGALADARPVWLVHAGVRPGWLDLPEVAGRLNSGARDADWLRRDEVAFATRARYCSADGEMCRTDRDGEPVGEDCLPWEERWRGEALIVHGHWARRGYYRTGSALGLDSGCVYGGALTAWCLEEDRVLHVPSRSPRIFV